MEALPLALAGPFFQFNRRRAAGCRAGFRECCMVFNFSVALTWILFLALFPMGFFWLRRAWRILVRRDLSEVTLKHAHASIA
jgi:hypothetical protein